MATLAAGPMLLFIAKSTLVGAMVGGVLGGLMSALTGGSVIEGFFNGAFDGAIAGIVSGGMTFAFTGGASLVTLTLRQSLFTGAASGSSLSLIGNLGDKLIKGVDISWGQMLLNTALAGLIAGACAGAFYGLSKGFSALKVKFLNKGASGAGKVNYLDNLDDFAKGNKKFDDVLDDYAKAYADKVKSNSDWSWNKSIAGGEQLSIKQKKLIKELAIKNGYIPDVKVVKVEGMKYGFADFESAGAVKHNVDLPEEMWKLSDSKQFEWLNNKIGGKLEGYTWHHTEVPGKMQLVETGIHNITTHNGGRTAGMWADAPR